ncbi:TRL domain-containing protein [Leptospira neocaledonica]|uniref:TRL-like family protein n=1 Tax=Leptospira neocaledonica TaxID=2023192 RepID=A0A2M9ZY07_9LEPT|nr:TRL domain-containing protein [Leptospira neocaledonica]PJZ76803.1 hypothetical protein CH365_12360 [Leptospira neocaledonica]
MRFLFLTILLVCASCAAVPPGGGGALIYNDFRAPYKTFPVKLGTQTAESSAHCILALACFGDISVSSIAQKKGIKFVTNIEYEFFNISFFYSRTKIIIVGSDEAKNP